MGVCLTPPGMLLALRNDLHTARVAAMRRHAAPKMQSHSSKEAAALAASALITRATHFFPVWASYSSSSSATAAPLAPCRPREQGAKWAAARPLGRHAARPSRAAPRPRAQAR